jgi:hypothetical protein
VAIALIAVQARADAGIDRIAQVLHEGRIAQREAAALRRGGGLGRAHRKTGGAVALEEQVAREIVGSRAQRRERRRQPRLQLDEAADVGRGPLSHR